jgi:hypothetical protein
MLSSYAYDNDGYQKNLLMNIRIVGSRKLLAKQFCRFGIDTNEKTNDGAVLRQL